MGNKITKWIELHIPSSPSDLPLLQFPVPNHAPQQHTIQQNTIPSIWKLVFVLAMGCCCWGWKPFGKKMQKKCFLSLLGWDAMLSCFLNKRKHKLSKKKQIWVALSVSSLLNARNWNKWDEQSASFVAKMSFSNVRKKMQSYFLMLLVVASLTFIDMVKRKVCCKWDENSDANDGGQETEINYPDSGIRSDFLIASSTRG